MIALCIIEQNSCIYGTKKGIEEERCSTNEKNLSIKEKERKKKGKKIKENREINRK